MENKARKVLIADDEPDIRELLQYNLSGAGYEVSLAKDGDEALDKAKRIKPDLILLDVMMPKKSGLKYTRSRRRKAVGQRDGFLSFISGISMAGIALGVAALIVVLSVMNGFQKEVRDRMLSVLSHIEITSPNGLSDWEPIAETLAKQAHVLGVAPMVSSQGLLSR